MRTDLCKKFLQEKSLTDAENSRQFITVMLSYGCCKSCFQQGMYKNLIQLFHFLCLALLELSSFLFLACFMLPFNIKMFNISTLCIQSGQIHHFHISSVLWFDYCTLRRFFLLVNLCCSISLMANDGRNPDGFPRILCSIWESQIAVSETDFRLKQHILKELYQGLSKFSTFVFQS